MKILPKRKSIRLKKYDYKSQGYYFITICTQNRWELFGNIDNRKMVLDEAGEMVNQWWLKIPGRFNNISLDKYQIMPNHIHGVIVIKNARTHGSAHCGSTHGSTPTDRFQNVGANPCVCPSINQPPTLGKIIQWFKTMTTNQYIRNVKNKKWKPFYKHLWQRNYWEHVIRTQTDLDKIRQYIKINPEIWYRDRNNPKNWGIKK